jgi:hypothetical protein
MNLAFKFKILKGKFQVILKQLLKVYFILPDSKLKDSDWNFKEFLDSLIKDIDELSHQMRKTAIDKMEKVIEKTLKLKLTEPIVLMMLDAPPNLWIDSLNIFNNVLAETKAFMELKLKCNYYLIQQSEYRLKKVKQRSRI